VSANHILQNFLSAENFPELKWTLIKAGKRYAQDSEFFKQSKI
jgi:hypothetical protein